MASDIAVSEFFEVRRTRHALDTSQLHPLQKALEDHSAPLAPLAAEIARPILEANQRVEGKLDPNFAYGALWRVISAAIKQMTPQMDRIVDLVIELARVPDDTGYMAFAQDMNEHWNEFATNFVLPKVSTSNEEKQTARKGLININAFNAKLSTKSIEHLDQLGRLDQRGRAGHVFRTALEETPWEVYYVEWIEKVLDMEGEDREDPENIAWRDAQLAERDVRILNYWIPAAAAWIEYDGRGILEFQGPIRRNPKIASLWQGSDVFSKQRFELWKDRFIWVSRVTALEHDTRRRAAKAAELMQQIVQDEAS